MPVMRFAIRHVSIHEEAKIWFIVNHFATLKNRSMWEDVASAYPNEEKAWLYLFMYVILLWPI